MYRSPIQGPHIFTILECIFLSPDRVALTTCLVVACGGTFLLEQPSSSLLMLHDRMQELIEVWMSRVNAPLLYIRLARFGNSQRSI